MVSRLLVEALLGAKAGPLRIQDGFQGAVEVPDVVRQFEGFVRGMLDQFGQLGHGAVAQLVEAGDQPVRMDEGPLSFPPQKRDHGRGGWPADRIRHKLLIVVGKPLVRIGSDQGLDKRRPLRLE